MRKILITGENSYIGTSFQTYINVHFSDTYEIDVLDMIGDTWRQTDFSCYDCVLHVAGIAHQKETKKNASMYYVVNRDLAVDAAGKAKAEGVKQFVFLSSMSVYGMDTGVITRETQPNPKSNYGKSKLQAEQCISSLEDQSYKVVIVRPPMVYGKGCKGNFQTVLKLVRRLPFFPRVKNQRSMIYIQHLCAFLELVIRDCVSGVYMPQNAQYTETSHMATQIAVRIGKPLCLSRVLGVAVDVVKPCVGMLKKAFGTLIYQDCEDFEFSYCTVDMDESFKDSVDD